METRLAAQHDQPVAGTRRGGPAGFGKESFLRALVVQLAAVLEASHGPRAAHQAVAQVGADLGGHHYASEYAPEAGPPGGHRFR